MTPLVVAADPGARHTGLCVRRGDELVEHLLLVRHPDDDLCAWVNLNTRAVMDLWRRQLPTWMVWHDGRFRPVPALVACEDLNEPSPHMGLTNVRGLVDTACVVGALMHTFGSRLVLVPPGKHGQGPRQAYPDALWGAREKKGTGVLSHARAAWDQAAAAADMVKMGVA